MKSKTAEILLERAKYKGAGELPSLPIQTQSTTLDYASNALNQQGMYTGKQYIEFNEDFQKLHLHIDVEAVAAYFANLSRQHQAITFSLRNFSRQWQQFASAMRCSAIKQSNPNI